LSAVEPAARYENRWSAPAVEGLSELRALAYRSNLLGADRRIANWGGGNTSSKLEETDHTGRSMRVLRVKGSGTDLATIEPVGFSGLRLDELLVLEGRDAMADADMVDHLLRSGVDPGQPRPSIETLLHAFVPASHVDHTHPDAVIALTCAPGGRRLAEEAFGDEAEWVDWVRPGFALSKLIAERVRGRPSVRFVMLEKHGLVTWGDSGEESYRRTLEAVERSHAALAEHGSRRPFGASCARALDLNGRRELLVQAMPVLRGALSRERHHVLQLDTSDEVLEFLAGEDSRRLSQVGAACPDHLVNTKSNPLWVDWSGEEGEELVGALRRGEEEYERWYRDYYERHLDDETRPFAIDPPGPRVTLMPGLGMITSGTNATKADVTSQLYHRAIEVIRLAAAVSDFTSLSQAEAFAVEYWPLERYKLTLARPPRELDGRVALVTGAASGIGRACAEALVAAGAHVALADRNAEGAEETAAAIAAHEGDRRALALAMDVTDEAAVERAFAETVLAWGGVDIVVSSAGLASAASIEETTAAVWDRNFDVLGRGYFTVAREAVKIMRRQGIGGSIVFVGSKNALAAGKGAAAYSAAKAAELHLARCIAEEVGADGIRVNTVNPDAVVQGSGIFSSEWRRDRAAGYGIDPSQLEEHYRKRTTLGVSIQPEDVAQAVLLLASDRLAKSTGNILNVDGGIAAAYPR